MQLGENTRVYEKTSLPALATGIDGPRAKRQRNRRNNRFKREYREIMDNAILSLEKQGDQYTFWLGGERYHANVLKTTCGPLVHIRYAESCRETEQGVMERHRINKKRVLVGRSVYMGGKVDRSAEGNGVYKRVSKVRPRVGGSTKVLGTGGNGAC